MFGKTYKRKENKGKARGMTEKNLACTRKRKEVYFISSTQNKIIVKKIIECKF